MRPKVILIALCAAALILLPSVYFHRASGSAQTATSAAHDQASAAPAPAPGSTPVRSQAPWPVARNEAPEFPATDQAASVAEHKAQLGKLAMMGGTAALNSIVADLDNPDPEIRRAARVAAVDFGNQDAIYALQNQMQWTSDPQEQLDLQKAINFLQLPVAQVDGPQ